MTEEELKARLRSNLRKYRSEQGLTQEELAEKAGVSLSGYKNIESTERGASLEMLVKLGNALGVDPASLLLFDNADQSMSNIYQLLRNRSKSFIMAVEKIISAVAETAEDWDATDSEKS